MSNAAIKHLLYSIIATTAITPSLTACGSGDPERTAADSLVAQASAALDRGDFDSAAILLDSLSAAYPRQIEAGRNALKLRPRVMERKTEQQIAELQLQLAAASAYLDSIQSLFNFTPRSEDVMEPYYMAKSVPANWRDRNTAVARTNPAGDFTVISSLAGRSTRHTTLTLSGDGTSVTSGEVPFDAEALLSRESQRFSAGKADTLGVFATSMDGKKLTLQFTGGAKSAPAVTLSPAEVHAIADTWRMSRAIKTLASGASRLEQLKAKLQLARDQQARQSAPGQSEDEK